MPGRGRVLSWGNTEGAAIQTKSFSEEAADTGDGDAPLSSLLLPFCFTPALAEVAQDL